MTAPKALSVRDALLKIASLLEAIAGTCPPDQVVARLKRQPEAKADKRRRPRARQP